MEKETSDPVYPLNYFDDFVGIRLDIECCSWEYEFAARLWGPNLGEKTTVGTVRKVTYHRKTKKPRFEVFVADTNETYTNLDLEYILKYSKEVPLKYHELKAQYIVNLSRKAGKLLPSEVNTNAGDSELAPSKDPDVRISLLNENQAPAKRKTRGGIAARLKGKQKAANVLNPSKQSVVNITEDDDLVVDSGAEEDVDSENLWDALEDQEANEEVNEGLEEDIDIDFLNWQYNQEPVQPEQAFTGVPGPQHTLDPENAVPFDYFSLYIPIYFWSKIATYTNAKAEIEAQKLEGRTRAWSPTCGAEIKAWFAAVMWWCLMRSCTFEQFYSNIINPILVSKWFPSFKRWQQIKRYLKVSDPHKDQEQANKANKMYKVQELYDIFIQACKSYFYPGREVAVDEAVKKFKGRCTFKQYIKGKPVRFGIKIFVSVVVQRRIYLMLSFILAKLTSQFQRRPV